MRIIHKTSIKTSKIPLKRKPGNSFRILEKASILNLITKINPKIRKAAQSKDHLQKTNLLLNHSKKESMF
jgi:hypothetical protein